MKHNYAIIVAVVVTTISLAALAEKQASAGKSYLLKAPAGKSYLLKAGGETVAELRVRGAAIVAIESADSAGHAEYNTSTETMVTTGGAILKITAGTNSISVRADEIESVPDSK
jgi:hypothetical protein